MARHDWQTGFGILRSLVIYWRPGRQRSLRRLYQPFVPAGGLVFDIGAHLGDRTRAFADLGARVVALEPQPQLERWLRRLVGSHPSVVVRPQAVGRAAGQARLAISRLHPTVSTLSADWQEGLSRRNRSFRRVAWDRTVSVEVTTLDALIREYGVPDFCKLDVEGFEAEVLAGLSRPLPALSLEFVSGALEVARDSVRRLAELGPYAFNAIPGERREFLFRGWRPPDALAAWLEAGAGGIASGDLYARLQPARAGSWPGHGA
ncbi:methyltransferase, FkbM family domain protein [Thioalkalivibrio nitratireducens DSM 14787]|uniref:Methyltransferase, FkbM family domain protein n=1 Tax=Thioalkalivibrio nitratireducens (strain DSM 14787 / UNIQEM 213 / ALEN2) TaxID=1255043 RepID=L0DYN3_THIND|nr:FkbM family methyltransferase [Thioalkalivibrio nitratireducens]AGA33461.1 methyltransferase, FkbM family domain protein [Thioalkalivibrio nitratireducens DSM 14787]